MNAHPTNAIEKRAPGIPAEANLSTLAYDVEECLRQKDLINKLLAEQWIEAKEENGFKGHYGIFPGTTGKALYKPGAESIAMLFRIGVRYSNDFIDLPNDHLMVRTTAEFFHIPTGSTLGSFSAVCSSREGKYRWRNIWSTLDEPIPEDYRSNKGGYKSRGFRAWMEDGSWIWQKKQKGENPDIADQYNTILAMAEKRAYVGGIRQITAASDIFFAAYADPDDARRDLNNREDEDQGSGSPNNPPKSSQGGSGSNQKRSRRESSSSQEEPIWSEIYPTPNCPKCNGPMWDNRKGAKHNPDGRADFVCKDRNCRYEWDENSGEWVSSQYQTDIFRAQYPDDRSGSQDPELGF